MKKDIIDTYLNYVSDKINQLEDLIKDLSLDALNDAKSSAGDKHETGLAMMHLEQEKMNAKLLDFIEQKKELLTINTEFDSKKIGKGSVIETDDFLFLVAVALPQVKYQEKTLFGLSLSAPLTLRLKDLSIGSEINIGSKTQTIISIF